MADENRFIERGDADLSRFYSVVPLSPRRSRSELDRLKKQRQQLEEAARVTRLRIGRQGR